MDDVDVVAPAAEKTLLRFLTCGSVDDGKSTLIGRLLYDANAILIDQLATLERESKRFGTTGDDIDLALPALSLARYPIRGLGKRLRPQGEAVGPAVDHAAHDACVLQHLQVS